MSPYDFEIGQTNNQRLEFVFLEHTYRWLKPGGILLFVIPQPQLRSCARLLSEHFTDLRVYRLTEPASVKITKRSVQCGLDSSTLNHKKRIRD